MSEATQNDSFELVLINGIRYRVTPDAFDEILKADKKSAGSLVKVSETDYICVSQIVCAFRVSAGAKRTATDEAMAKLTEKLVSDATQEPEPAPVSVA